MMRENATRQFKSSYKDFTQVYFLSGFQVARAESNYAGVMDAAFYSLLSLHDWRPNPNFLNKVLQHQTLSVLLTQSTCTIKLYSHLHPNILHKAENVTLHPGYGFF